MVSNNKTKGGFIEISSKDLLRTVLLDRVDVDYGTLLLDAKNITVDASGSSGGSLDNGLRAQVYYNYFNDSFSYFGSVGVEHKTLDHPLGIDLIEISPQLII